MSEELSHKEIPAVETPARQFEAPQLGLALEGVSRLVRVRQARTAFGVDGSGLSVAVLDTGLNTGHVDFVGRILAQVNFTNDNGSDPADATDGNGHGTNVAGIIAADGDHRGIAPGAGIIPLKVLRNDGGGSFAHVRDAMQWVLDHHEEHAIAAVCMSLGAGDNSIDDSGLEADALNTRIQSLREKRISVVIAAGNDYFTHGSAQGMAYPAILRHSVSVGAVFDEFEGGFN